MWTLKLDILADMIVSKFLIRDISCKLPYQRPTEEINQVIALTVPVE